MDEIHLICVLACRLYLLSKTTNAYESIRTNREMWHFVRHYYENKPYYH